MILIGRSLSFVADLLLLGLTAVMLFVLLTGGGVLFIGGTRISVTSIGNPLLAWLLIATLRWWLGRTTPFLAIRSLELDTLDERAVRLWRRISHALRTISDRQAMHLVIATASASLVVRLANAYWHYGFFAGDDVEIHEMTLAALFGYDWEIWNLRNAFYPMTFILPVQWLLVQVGVSDPFSLVFAGRAVVAAFSSATLLLVFAVGRRALGTPSALLAVMLLALSALHVTLGSTELPRPVAAFFLVAGFALMLRTGFTASVGTGLALAMAGAMRFSEAVFIVPCVLGLTVYRRYQDALLTAASFACVWLLILGVSDWLYWGTPFSSLVNAADYSVVKGLSSRGYEPFHWYLSHIPDWSNFFTVTLGLLAFRFRGAWIPAFWAWIPLLVLSLLSHKEPRYLVPVLPFLALAAGDALWRLLHRFDGRSRRPGPVGLALLVGTGAAAVFEISNFRFERSEASVELANAYRDEWRDGGVAVEQLWRVGGRLYLSDVPTLVDLAPEQLEQAGYLEQVLADRNVRWVLLRHHSLRPDHLAVLVHAAYVELPIDHPTYRMFKSGRVP
jgi:hypothetical protein